MVDVKVRVEISPPAPILSRRFSMHDVDRGILSFFVDMTDEVRGRLEEVPRRFSGFTIQVLSRRADGQVNIVVLRKPHRHGSPILVEQFIREGRLPRSS